MPSLVLLAAAEATSSRLLVMRPVDYVIVAIYFAVVLAIGFYLKKFTNTGEDFFMAGRKMTAWIAGLSFISANLSSLETMGWSAMAYQYGMLGAHAYLISGALPILFLAVVMMPFYYICKTHSVPGLPRLALRPGRGVDRRRHFRHSDRRRQRRQHVRHGQDPPSAARLEHERQHLGGFPDRRHLRDPRRAGLRRLQRGVAILPHLVRLAADPDPGPDQCRRLDQDDGQNPGKRARSSIPPCPAPISRAFGATWASFDNPMGIDWFGMVFGLGFAVGFAYWCTDFLQVQRVIVAKDLRAAQNGTIIGAVLKMCVPLIVTIPGLLGLAVLLNSRRFAHGAGGRERRAGQHHPPHLQ